MSEDSKFHLSRRINIVNIAWFISLALSGFWFLHSVTTDIAILMIQQEQTNGRMDSLAKTIKSYDLIHYKLDQLLGDDK